MSEERTTKLNQKKTELLPIADCFAKGSPMKVSDLIELLDPQKRNYNKNVSADNAISTISIDNVSWIDTLVVLTLEALPGNYMSVLKNYCFYKENGSVTGTIQHAYQNIDPNSGYDKLGSDWRATRKIQTNTLLTKVLDEIKLFANSNGTTDDKVEKFKKFLTNLQNTPFMDLGGQTGMNAGKNDKDAMGKISHYIENSRKKCVIFTGAPGTGKTYCVEEHVEEKYKKYKEQGITEFKKSEYFVQFHSSYDYTDFVEGLRPIQKGGEMVFVRMDGIFKAFCRKVVEQNKKNGILEDGSARESPKKEPIPKYYFVIDEVNRADLGRVFGELMYCFEKRGKPVATQYANLPAHDKNGAPIIPDCFRNGFYIPHNVVIIGTMNDIDRSVETFDFALRRRFDWVEINANDVMQKSLENMKNITGTITGTITTDLVEWIQNMNNAIAEATELGLSKAFAIGPSYFEGYDGKNLEEIWDHNIEPILREYVRGRQSDKVEKFVDKCRAALHVDG